MSRKIDELLNPNGCFNKAADDEPIFVLRANDPIAARVVRQWATQYLEDKRENSTDGTLTNVQVSKAQEARGLANQMDAWRDYHDLGTVTGKGRPSILRQMQRRIDFWRLVSAVLAAASLGNLVASIIVWGRS